MSRRTNENSPTEAGSRFFRRRAGWLFVVWAVAGVWNVGHTVAHVTDPETHHHVSIAESPLLCSLAADHDHGHSHPESSPVVSAGRAPEIAGAALLASCHVIEVVARATQWPSAPSASTNSLRAGVSGPRAPPHS